MKLRKSLMSRITSLGLIVTLVTVATVSAQTPTGKPVEKGDSQKNVQAGATTDEPEAPLFKDIYRSFYDTYKLGPADEVSVRVFGQPEYSLERAKIAPTGHIYHPLLGDVQIAGLTIAELTKELTNSLSEYLKNPKVTVSLLEAHSAKVGVLGDVLRPGIIVMNRPLTVFEAITEAGGFAETGSKSGVTLLRQSPDGTAHPLTVNVKRILDGKAGAEENLALRAGDTVIVHGNTKKKIAFVMSMTGFSSFLSFIALRGQGGR